MWPREEFERWSASPRYSKMIQVPSKGRLLSLKVPLPSRFEHLVAESAVFSPEMFVERLAAKKTRIALLIEAVPKLLEGRDWDDWDIPVCRLPGESDSARDSTPSYDQIDQAVRSVRELWAKTPGALVAVVSVDGYNTAGTIIVSLLAAHVPFDEAMKMFSEARTPGVFSAGHFRLLSRRFGKECARVSPPTHFEDLAEGAEEEVEKRRRKLDVVAPDTGKSLTLCLLSTTDGIELPNVFVSNQAYDKNLAEIGTFRKVEFEVEEPHQKKLDDFLGYLRARSKAAVVADKWYLVPQHLSSSKVLILRNSPS